MFLIEKNNFLGWLFVTYGNDLVSIPRYYILVLYKNNIQIYK